MSATAPVRGAGVLRAPAYAPSRATPRQKQAILPRPHLVAVAPARSTAGRLPFVILIGAVLVGGLVAVLLLHMAAAQDAFRISGLQQRLATLTDQEQQEAQLVAADSSPTALQARAAALGMEPTKITSFHRRPDGRAVGIATPYYVAPPAPRVKKTVTTNAKAGKSTAKHHAQTSTTTSTTTSTKHHAPTSPATTKHHKPAPPKHHGGHSKP
jgi:hypothetical protein